MLTIGPNAQPIPLSGVSHRSAAPLRFAGATADGDTFESKRVERAVEALKARRPELAGNIAIPIEQWLAQFDNDADRLLAIKLLDAMAVYDVGELRRMGREQFQWLQEQPGFDLDTTKFTDYGAGKSGGLVQYFFRQVNRLSNQSCMYFDRVPDPPEIVPGKPIDTLVVMDDFLGSGAQANYFFTEMKKALEESGQEYRKIYFLTLVGFDEGIKLLKEKFPEIEVRCATRPKKIFDPANTQFTAQEKEALKEMLIRYGDRVYPPSQFGKVATPGGYRDGQALVSFFYNTPSNTLPIFWSDYDGWQPLFERFHSWNRETGGWAFKS